MKPMWIVVADHTCARFFQTDSLSAPREEFETLVHEEGRLHGREITSDLPGMTADDTREHLPAFLP